MNDEIDTHDEEATGDAPPPPSESDAAPKAEKAKDKKAQKKPAKGKDAKGKSGKGKGAKAAKSESGVSVATHPRARAQVRRAKGWGGLAGFGIAAFVSYRAGVPPEQVGIRALAAGAAGYMVAWATTVTIWRHLVLAEIRAHYERRRTSPPTIPAKPDSGGPKGERPAA